jgi:polar amino acid transport system substrate-binding protein
VSKEYADRGISEIALSGLYPSPVAIAFRDPELASAFAQVLQEMRDDGTYDEIFKRYGKTGWTEAFDVKGPGL